MTEATSPTASKAADAGRSSSADKVTEKDVPQATTTSQQQGDEEEDEEQQDEDNADADGGQDGGEAEEEEEYEESSDEGETGNVGLSYLLQDVSDRPPFSLSIAIMIGCLKLTSFCCAALRLYAYDLSTTTKKNQKTKTSTNHKRKMTKTMIPKSKNLTKKIAHQPLPVPDESAPHHLRQMVQVNVPDNYLSPYSPFALLTTIFHTNTLALLVLVFITYHYTWGYTIDGANYIHASNVLF